MPPRRDHHELASCRNPERRAGPQPEDVAGMSWRQSRMSIQAQLLYIVRPELTRFVDRLAINNPSWSLDAPNHARPWIVSRPTMPIGVTSTPPKPSRRSVKPVG